MQIEKVENLSQTVAEKRKSEAVGSLLLDCHLNHRNCHPDSPLAKCQYSAIDWRGKW